MRAHFSSRLAWDAFHPNRLATALAERRASGTAIVDLTESNPTRAGFDYSPEILSAFADPRSLLYEPAPAGALEARQAIADARGVEPERIVLTSSSSEAYGWLFKLLADSGDEVLVPRPSYPLFEFLAALEGVRMASYPLAYHGRWSIELDDLERTISERTRAVVVVNPNNPTGSFLKRDEFARLAAICARHGLAIVSDEVFAEYAFAPDARRLGPVAATDAVLAFTLGGLSKSAGLPQMKLGWIIASGPREERDRALARLELIADTYLSVSTPVQHAAPALLRAGGSVREQIAARTRANLERLRATGAEVLDLEGGWYAILRVPRTRTEEQWALDLLERRGVLVQPGYFYDFETEAFLVVSLLTPEAVFAEGIARARSEIAT